MMLRAIHHYEGRFPGTLKFSKDEVFLYIREENEHWRLVSKKDGTLGCVPAKFVEKHEDVDGNAITQWAKKALESLTASEKKHIQGKDDLVRLLSQISRKALENETVMPLDRFAQLKISSFQENKHQVKAESNSERYVAAEQNIVLAKNFECRLVDTIRLGTNCSYSDCRSVYFALMDLLSSAIPNFRQILQSVDAMKTEQEYSQSPDWYLIKIKLGFFESRERNDEECTWRLHDDQNDILERLNELIVLLERADPKLVVCYLHTAEFRPVHSLIRLYQRETKHEMRSKLLRCIGICCSLDSACIRICLGSVLPAELIRESRCSSYFEIPQLALQLRFLSILIAQSSDLPVDLHGSLDEELFTNLLTLCDTSRQSSNLIDLENVSLDCQISTTNGYDQSEQTRQQNVFSYSVAIFLLACNWHFSTNFKADSPETSPSSPGSNKTPLLQALISQPVASRLFLELIIQTFNRNLDPTFKVTFLPNDKNCNSENYLAQWADFSRLDVSWTESTAESVEKFLRKFETNSRLNDNIHHDDLEYIQNLWNRDLGSTHELNNKPTFSIHKSSNIPTNSVLKFLCDLFSFPDTARLIYHNDLDVIIEVINRQLRDLEPDCENLTHLLLLLGLICTNSNFTNRDSVKIEETLKVLSPVFLSSSYNARCKTLALSAFNRIKAVIDSPDKKY
ncbi:unnamed protein product [Heterobilharzia americana]|nr:unnamed protein product [Heterobilharzia americana]